MVRDFSKMSVAKRRSLCTRRRTRSVGSMPFTWQPPHLRLQTQSDEMCSSSTSKEKDCSNIFQSDSDDVCSPHLELPCFYNEASVSEGTRNNIESDSFNENSPCRRSTRRKRKFKRIAMELETSNSSRFYSHYISHKYNKKLRVMRHSLNCPSNRLWLNSGKRKRSMKEKISVSLDGGDSSDLGREAKVLALSKLSLNDFPDDQYSSMEVSYNVGGISSSSLSSSGSEAGIYTNDEGREGDDEQSDWVGDVGLTAGGSFNRGENDDSEGGQLYRICPKLFLNLSADDKKTYKFFSDKGKDRDVRASRRRGRSFKPNFNIILPAEEKNSKFSPDLIDNIPNKKSEMDVEGCIAVRRHTFSGYKKRKRIPPAQFLLDTSDRSSQMSLPTIHKLSDISSSDSKDSLQ